MAKKEEEKVEVTISLIERKNILFLLEFVQFDLNDVIVVAAISKGSNFSNKIVSWIVSSREENKIIPSFESKFERNFSVKSIFKNIDWKNFIFTVV